MADQNARHGEPSKIQDQDLSWPKLISPLERSVRATVGFSAFESLGNTG
jgi:hypothetical protein